MTEAEIASLAQKILARITEELSGWDKSPISEVRKLDDGELVPVYESTSQAGYGSYICTYMPLELVRLLIMTCEANFDTATIEFLDKQTGKTQITKISAAQTTESRADSIEMMAQCAVLHVLSTFGTRLQDSLMESIKDSLLIAENVLGAVIGNALLDVPGKLEADARPDIDIAAKRVADKKRALLVHHIRQLPHILAERGRGRIPKTDFERKQDSQTYRPKVEAAYRKVRATTGKTRIKALVAKELGEGGFNPKTGVDSSLQAFRLKLERLEIDYEEIARKVESELNSNS